MCCHLPVLNSSCEYRNIRVSQKEEEKTVAKNQTQGLRRWLATGA